MKLFKNLVSIFLLSIYMLSHNIVIKAVDNSGLKSGIYDLKNDIYHSSETGRSMARTYLSPNMKIEVRGGKVYFTVKFSGAQYMSNFRMIVDGAEVDVNTIDRNSSSDTVTLKFKGNSPKAKIIVKIYVGPMGRDVSFNIIPKLETIKLIQAIEEPKPKKEISPKKEVIKETVPKETVSDNNEKIDNNNKKVGMNVSDNQVHENKAENKAIVNGEQAEKKEPNKKEVKQEEVISTAKVELKEAKHEKTNEENEKNKDDEEKNFLNEKLIIEKDSKNTIYEKTNKKVILGVVVCLIVSATIFIVKKYKK